VRIEKPKSIHFVLGQTHFREWFHDHTDRVLVHEGKMQTYGTQTQGQGGVLKPLPIADEANVEKRRADAGMEPLAEYLKTLRQENEKLSGAQRRETGKD
jgi:Family of unknown function (DUF6624)